MTTTLDLQELMVEALLKAGTDADQPPYPTDAEDRIFRPGDLPAQPGQFPLFKLRIPREQRQSLGRGSVQFLTLGTVRVIGEVSEPADVTDPGTISAAEASLWALKRQAEVAIINSYPLFSLVQQLASIDAQFAYSSDAETHLAGIQIDFTFEFYEGAEDFAPLPTDPLEEIEIEDESHPAAGITIILPQ
jgi:hypothetical protein